MSDELRPMSEAPQNRMILSLNRYGAPALIMWNPSAIFHEDVSKPPVERFSWSGAWDDGERGTDLDDDAFVPYDPPGWLPVPEALLRAAEETPDV